MVQRQKDKKYLEVKDKKHNFSKMKVKLKTFVCKEKMGYFILISFLQKTFDKL